MNDYFYWLLDKIGVDYKISKYKNLYDELMYIPFEVVHPRDRNRKLDGEYLRLKYEKETGNNLSEMDKIPCCVLEMLVAFSIRLDAEWCGRPGEPEPGKVFWSMICNLGLKKYSDRRWSGEKFRRVVKNWMAKNNKSYMIFPIPNDLEAEFWDQAIHYFG